MWWNWQTRSVQGAVAIRPWRFKSSHPHFSFTDSGSFQENAMPKKFTETVESFECTVCGTRQGDEATAIRCEARLNEDPVFNLGDQVRLLVPLICVTNRQLREGQVTAISDLTLVDPDYAYRCLGKYADEFIQKHVRMYTVTLFCAACDQHHEAERYSCQLQKA
jgi:hypothetical protein